MTLHLSHILLFSLPILWIYLVITFTLFDHGFNVVFSFVSIPFSMSLYSLLLKMIFKTFLIILQLITQSKLSFTMRHTVKC